MCWILFIIKRIYEPTIQTLKYFTHMYHAIIITDNTFLRQDLGLGRGTGAHRIATHLRDHGVSVEVVDFILRWSMEEFQQLCQKLIVNETLFLGVGTNLFDDDQGLEEKLCWFRKTYIKIPVVLGGNNLPSRGTTQYDYMVEGYGENSMLELIDMLSGKKQKEKIKWHSTHDRLINSTVDYPLKPADTHDLHIEYKDSDFIGKNESLGLETARGCIFKCKFCTYPLIGKKKADYHRDPENIKTELLNNWERFGTTNYVVCEDTFNDRDEKLEQLANVFSKLPFKPKLVAYVRFDLIMARTHSTKLLKACGLRGAFFGIETFNREAGKLIGKGNDPDKVKDALLKWTEEMPEVQLQCGHIVGLPLDNEETQWQTVEWYEKSKIPRWNFNPLYINNLDKVVHTSEFSKNYKLYGFEQMTENEIQNELNSEKDQSLYKEFNHNMQPMHRARIFFWKNNRYNMNYFSATRLTNRLNWKSQTRRIGPWNMFSFAGLGYDMDEMMKWKYHGENDLIPQEEIKKKTNMFIKNYIRKKINYQYSKKKTR